jgi:hypothetical protein
MRIEVVTGNTVLEEVNGFIYLGCNISQEEENEPTT